MPVAKGRVLKIDINGFSLSRSSFRELARRGFGKGSHPIDWYTERQVERFFVFLKIKNHLFICQHTRIVVVCKVVCGGESDVDLLDSLSCGMFESGKRRDRTLDRTLFGVEQKIDASPRKETGETINGSRGYCRRRATSNLIMVFQRARLRSQPPTRPCVRSC